MVACNAMDILEPNTSLIKRQLGWSAAVLGVVVVLWSVYWKVAADQAVDGAQSWAVEQQKAGYKINWQEFDASGYPFSLDIDVLMPVIEARDEWRWSTQKLEFHASLWDWSEIDVSAPTQHRIFLSRGTKFHTYDLSAKTLNAHIILDGEGIQSLNVHTTSLKILEEERSLGGLDSGQVRLEITAAAGADYSTMAGALEARLQGIEMPDLSISPLGSDISRLSFRAELFGGPPSALTPQELTAWRDLGGVIEVRHLILGYGPLELETAGTMALDKELQPIGSLTAQVQGYAEAIDAMRVSGMISGGDAFGAKLLLGALSKADPSTGKSGLSIPLSLQQKTLHAGPIALAKIPSVIW